MIDLANLFGDNGSDPPPPPVDLSGRPVPTRAIATLSSGIQIECAVIFNGHMPDGQRKYKVVAELDWSTANVVRVEVDRWPSDVYITMKVPDGWDDVRCVVFGQGIEWGLIT